MDLIRVDLARLHNLFDLGNGDLGCRSYGWIEVPGRLPMMAESARRTSNVGRVSTLIVALVLGLTGR